MKNKKVIVIALVIIGGLLVTVVFKKFLAPPRVIAIPGGQEYIAGDLREYFVVVNPPRSIKALQKLIVDYNHSYAVIAPPPPADMEYVFSYSRQFFRESKAFPRNITFSSHFQPKDILTEEYNLSDRIAIICADINGTSYNFTLIYGENPISETREELRHEFEELSDPTVNGLYNNVPEHMIPRHSRGYDRVIRR